MRVEGAAAQQRDSPYVSWCGSPDLFSDVPFINSLAWGWLSTVPLSAHLELGFAMHSFWLRGFVTSLRLVVFLLAGCFWFRFGDFACLVLSGFGFCFFAVC